MQDDRASSLKPTRTERAMDLVLAIAIGLAATAALTHWWTT